MATGAAKWVWENSRASNGSLIVLLAIADECGEGEFTEMKVSELARKARLSERGTQAAVRDLVALGELSVAPATGRGNRNRYSPCAGNPADSAPFTERVQNLHPAESAPFTERSPRSAPKGAESAPLQIPDVFDLGSVVSSERPKTKNTSETPPRPDIDRLCEHLADRIEANGSSRPKVNQRWRTAARLMLDADKRTEEDAHKAIDWCQQNNFWLKNIRSMEKLRQHYERLRLDAIDEQRKKARPSSNSHQPSAEELNQLRQNWARPLDEMEAGNDPRGNDRPDRLHNRRLPAAEDRARNGGPLV